MSLLKERLRLEEHESKTLLNGRRFPVEDHKRKSEINGDVPAQTEESIEESPLN